MGIVSNSGFVDYAIAFRWADAELGYGLSTTSISRKTKLLTEV